jgi:hypothetical protein
MEHRELNVFAHDGLDQRFKLAILRDLRRLYENLAAEPVPPQFQGVVERLSRALDRPTSAQDHAAGSVRPARLMK